MKKDWRVPFGGVLILLSVVLYALNYAIYHDARDIGFYTLLDLAFLPISVLLVTLVIHRVLNLHEKQALLTKLNMVIGVFFSEVGNPLLRSLTQFLDRAADVRKEFLVTGAWSDAQFAAARQVFKRQPCRMDSQRGDIEALRRLLLSKRDFMLTLLENPNLLEHEAFTDLMWAVLHLAEELAARGDLTRLSPTDYDHLSGDMKRAYEYLVAEWVAYMQHLKRAYPYLFSLAVRTNPLDPEARPEVTA